MSVLVVYRILYGTKYLNKSIESVYDSVDRVFVGWSQKPWTQPKKVKYLDNYIDFPNLSEIEESVETTLNKFNDCGHKIYSHLHQTSTPERQFNYLHDKAVFETGIRDDYVVFMEPDYVWDKDEFKKFLNDFIDSGEQYWSAKQIELWKNEDWRIPQRERPGCTIYNIKNNNIPIFGFGHTPRYEYKLMDYYHYNMGFCMSEKTTLYKHLCALHFSSIIGDSIPNERWYEDKWLNWTPETTELEISENYKHLIERAIPYTTPKKMKDFLNA